MTFSAGLEGSVLIKDPTSFWVRSWLASRYRPGDRIFLIGYSRGAYAARSLAGVIDRVGLLQGDHATEADDDGDAMDFDMI